MKLKWGQLKSMKMAVIHEWIFNCALVIIVGFSAVTAFALVLMALSEWIIYGSWSIVR